MIQVCKPTIDEQTLQELNDVLRSGWFGNGPKVKEFEDKFAKYVGRKFAIATHSGTAALHLCLLANNIKGGELITTPMTFVSDAIVGEWCGMDVTFADIDPETLCIDPDSIVITENTKAIIAVDLHGRLADIKKIREKATTVIESFSGMTSCPLIIEDAAHAMFTPGVGEHADMTMYSFQAVKTMPIGDGGMITTDNEELAKKIRSLYWLGVKKSTWERLGKKYTWDYNLEHGGIKGYMTDIQAVIGIGQLRRLDSMLARRRAIQARYNEAFKGQPWFKEPVFSHTVQYYTGKFDNRDGLGDFLAVNDIATSVHFKPLSEMDYWKKNVKRPLPNTEVWKKLLSLPCHNALTDEEQEYVIKKVFEFYAQT